MQKKKMPSPPNSPTLTSKHGCMHRSNLLNLRFSVQIESGVLASAPVLFNDKPEMIVNACTRRFQHLRVSLLLAVSDVNTVMDHTFSNHRTVKPAINNVMEVILVTSIPVPLSRDKSEYFCVYC